MKKILLSILLMSLALGLSAQYLEKDPPPSPVQRIFFGGNLDMGFGTVTQISLSPEVGYRITNLLSWNDRFESGWDCHSEDKTALEF